MPVPTLDKLSIFSPSDITISWNPVKSYNERILGYKVRLWEQESKDTLKHRLQSIKRPKITNGLSPNRKLLEYRIAGAEQSQITLHGLKKDTPYSIYVLAYSARGDGPPSLASEVQLHRIVKNKEERIDPAASARSSESMIAVDFRPNVNYY